MIQYRALLTVMGEMPKPVFERKEISLPGQRSGELHREQAGSSRVRAGERGGGPCGWGGNQWPQNIDLELVTSCHFIQWQQSPEISLGSSGD